MAKPSPAGWRSLTGGYAILKFPEHARRIGEIISLWTDVEEHMVLVLGYFLERQIGAAEAMIRPLNSSEARIKIFEEKGNDFLIETDDKKYFANCLIPDSPDEMTFGQLRAPISIVKSDSYAGSSSRILTDPTGERRNRQFRQCFRGFRPYRPHLSRESGLMTIRVALGKRNELAHGVYSYCVIN
jgi:hypothetical protein